MISLKFKFHDVCPNFDLVDQNFSDPCFERIFGAEDFTDLNIYFCFLISGLNLVS